MAGEKSALEVIRSGASFREILIDAVEEIGDLWAGAEGERAATFEEVHGWMSKYEGPLGRWAVGAVFEAMGLELQPDEGLNEATITRAINDGPLSGSGLVLSSLFDRQAVINDLMAFGLLKAGEAFGVDVSSVEGLRGAVRESLTAEITAQLTDGAGDLIDGAPDHPLIAQVLASVPENPDWNAPTDFTPEGIANRERQARWRAGKTKHWELRS